MYGSVVVSVDSHSEDGFDVVIRRDNEFISIVTQVPDELIYGFVGVGGDDEVVDMNYEHDEAVVRSLVE